MRQSQESNPKDMNADFGRNGLDVPLPEVGATKENQPEKKLSSPS